MRRLVIFDFDGTITNKDTLFVFLKHCSTPMDYYLGLLWLSPLLVAFKCKLLPPQKAKEAILAHFLKGKSKIEIDRLIDQFTKTKMQGLIRPKALETIHSYLSENSTIYVCSASGDWITPWCRSQNIIVINSKLAFNEQEVFIGKLQGKNCNGIEKFNRIKREINTSQFHEIVAYGDSKGDLPMFTLAHQTYYKPFRS